MIMSGLKEKCPIKIRHGIFGHNERASKYDLKWSTQKCKGKPLLVKSSIVALFKTLLHNVLVLWQMFMTLCLINSNGNNFLLQHFNILKYIHNKYSNRTVLS